MPKAEVSKKLGPVLAADAWVIDGVSSRACDAADTIVFLDLPTGLCLRRALRRTLHHAFSQRPEMPEGCPEIAVVGKMLRILLAFPRRTRPKILRYREAGGGKRFFHLRHGAELERLRALLGEPTN